MIEEKKKQKTTKIFLTGESLGLKCELVRYFEYFPLLCNGLEGK